MNGIARQRDVGTDVIEPRAEIRERCGAIRQRDLAEQSRLFHVAANVDVGDDGATRINQPRHERAKEPHVHAVGSHVAPHRIAGEPHVLDDQLRLAAMLQYQRIERQESLRELRPARRLQTVSIISVHENRRAIQPYYSSVLAARDVAGEVRLHSALAQHRRREVTRRRRRQRDRGAHAVEPDRSERHCVRTENDGPRRLLGDVGEQHGAADPLDAFSAESDVVGADEPVEGEMVHAAG